MNYKTEKEPVLTPLGFCLRVIVNITPLNIEKTTISVLSVLLLIHASDHIKNCHILKVIILC